MTEAVQGFSEIELALYGFGRHAPEITARIAHPLALGINRGNTTLKPARCP